MLLPRQGCYRVTAGPLPSLQHMINTTLTRQQHYQDNNNNNNKTRHVDSSQYT